MNGAMVSVDLSKISDIPAIVRAPPPSSTMPHPGEVGTVGLLGEVGGEGWSGKLGTWPNAGPPPSSYFSDSNSSGVTGGGVSGESGTKGSPGILQIKRKTRSYTKYHQLKHAQICNLT